MRSRSPHSWGFTEIEIERDFLSIGKFGVAARRGRVSRWHAVSDAGGRAAPGGDRCGSEVRDQLLYLAVPLRRSGELDVDRAARADGLVRHDIRELQARDATSSGGDTARRSKSRRCGRGSCWQRRDAGVCLHAAGARHRMSRRQAGRARRQFHPDGSSRAGGGPAGDVHDRAARAAASARRSAGRASVGDGPGSGGGIRRFPDAAGDQPIRATVGALRRLGRLHPEELFRLCVSAAGELATFTTTANGRRQFPRLSARSTAGNLRTGDGLAACIAQRRARTECHRDSARSRRSTASASRS